MNDWLDLALAIMVFIIFLGIVEWRLRNQKKTGEDQDDRIL